MATAGGLPGARGDAANEVLAIIDRIGPVILSTAKEPSSLLRRAVGLLMADTNTTNIQVLNYALQVCLDMARQCKATLPTMDRVRKAALEEKPASFEAVQSVLLIIRLTLATEARILAFMRFRSREEVEEISAAFNRAFAQAIERAADDLDQGTYQALTNLFGTVIQHLATQGRLLPRIIMYRYPMVMPALRMSQRAYTDPSRYRELIDENHVVHPAFMPTEGKMLAV